MTLCMVIHDPMIIAVVEVRLPAVMPAEQVASFGQQSPMQRPAQPVELAPAYVYLASQESSYVSAQTIGVTGGIPLF